MRLRGPEKQLFIGSKSFSQPGTYISKEAALREGNMLGAFVFFGAFPWPARLGWNLFGTERTVRKYAKAAVRGIWNEELPEAERQDHRRRSPSFPSLHAAPRPLLGARNACRQPYCMVLEASLVSFW